VDGYSRGIHMHYDANAIVKFYADGEDWLVDGDYLVRNTTDHSMLSLTRDGRCDRAEPAFASLDTGADRPGLAMTRTTVHDYMDADWDRNICWLKGRAVVVLDRVTARRPGLFKAECVWKMLDRGELAHNPRGFTLTRSPGVPLSIVRDPAPGIPSAVRFGDSTSRMDFVVDLQAGTYQLGAMAKAETKGSDSFWLVVDGGEPAACHLRRDRFDRFYGSGVSPKSGAMPTIDIAKDGKHVVTVTLRERPGALLNRIEFLRTDGTLAVGVDAETAMLSPDDLLKRLPDRVFSLQGDGASRMSFSRRLNHKRIPILYAHQKFSGQLSEAGSLVNQTVFAGGRSDQPQAVDIRRISPETALVLLDGQAEGLFSIEPATVPLPSALGYDAKLLCLTRDRLTLSGVTRLLGKPTDGADVCDIDLKSGESLLTIGIRAAPPQQTPGLGRTTVVPADLLGELRAVAVRLLNDVPAPPVVAGSAAQSDVPALRVLATVTPTVLHDQPQPVFEMIATDIDKDGNEEVLALRGRFLTCLRRDGTVAWEFDGTDELYAAYAYDMDGDGVKEVFCGGKSKRLYVLNAEGKLLRDHEIETYWRVSRTTIHEPRLDDVLVRDFDGDGRWEAVLGTVDGFTQLINDKFEQVWIDGETNHGTTEMQVVDLDGDGVEEVAVGNRYGKLRVYRIRDGKLVGSLNSELGDVQLVAADLDGDGKVELLNASSTGAMKCGHSRRKVLWEFPNHGYTVRDMLCADFAETPGLETVIVADTEFAYLIDAEGTELAHRDLGAEPCNVALL
ncbi:MAG: VCBS repeat-containing protein, partial [Lentisphaeria bacterium]|nr:VCBS repeat-containing protein [Lentisphaeria bacterium]